MKRRSFLSGVLAIISFGCAKSAAPNKEIVRSPCRNFSRVVNTALIDLSDENPIVNKVMLFPDYVVSFKVISQNLVEVETPWGTKERLPLFNNPNKHWVIQGAQQKFWEEAGPTTFFKVTYKGLSALWREY
jgi:hypothetical protein